MEIKGFQTLKRGMAKLTVGPEDNNQSNFSNLEAFDKFKNQQSPNLELSWRDNLQTNIVNLWAKVCGDGKLPFCNSSRIKDVDLNALYDFLEKENFILAGSFFCDRAPYQDGFCESVFLFRRNEFWILVDNTIHNISSFYFLARKMSDYCDTIQRILKFTIPKSDSRIFMLVKEYGDLTLAACDIREQELDFDNYADDFAEFHNDILQFVDDEDEPQLVLIYGEPGTGKSRYLRALTSIIEKDVVYITKDMIDAFCSPDFISFALKELKNKVIICEDVDAALINDGVRTTATSNLLNMSSGVLSDILNIKIICTFNCEQNQIDSALLRKGRLRKKYEMKALDIKKSNNLLKKLGKNYTTDKPMTLAEIYGADEENGGETNKGRLGF